MGMANCFQPTYEELKRSSPAKRFRKDKRFQPTYEELKQIEPSEHLHIIISFSAYLRGIET